MKSKISHWIEAMRLRTLPLTLACIGLGAFMAYADGSFELDVFILSLLTALSLQILSNLANDYGDTVHGADSSEREGPSRAVQSGLISARQMKTAIIICAIISLVSGILLLMTADLSQTEFLIFVALGVLAIIAAILYTNGFVPYGYIGLGDLSVFLFFGLVGVSGSFYLHSHSFNALQLLPAASCGLLTVAVLNVNNIRDIESDLKAGKRSFAARLGRPAAEIYHSMLICMALVSALIYVLFAYRSIFQFLFLLSLPLLYANVRAVRNKKEASELDPYLRQMAISTLIFVLLFGLGMIL